VRQYCLAELVGSLAFFVALGASAASARPEAFALPWLVHPLVFATVAAVHLYGSGRHGAGPGRPEYPVGKYVRYGASWLASAASGLGAYHLSILLTAVLLVDPVATGYYSVTLSMLTPLNLLPIAVSTVLFPQMTTNLAAGNDTENAALIRSATGGLLLPLSLAVVLIFLLARDVLAFFGVPALPQQVLALQLIAFGILVSLVSTPAGSFLSATLYARSAARIGALTLGLGVALWVVLIPRIGIVGSALGYAVLMAVKGIASVIVSHRHRPWVEASPLRLVLLLGVLVGSAWVGYATDSLATRCLLSGIAFSLCGAILLREARELASAVIALFAPRIERS
jgi:O-antigen/teichoic acid export membrane protein